MYRVSKNGAEWFINVPHHRCDLFWDDYTHVKPFTRKSLRDAMTMHEYTDVECEHFYQLPFVWGKPFFKCIPKVINLLTTQGMKWKNEKERNGQDRKLIRFSKEKMLLCVGKK